MAKILLVEDDTMIKDMIARYLKMTRHEVLIATDGQKAIEIAQTEKPDVILMDMGLPILDGWQAAQQLKAAAETRAIPIIALTAYAMAEDQARCFAVGCDDYEAKPVNFSRLQEKIAAALHKASLKE